MNIIFHWNEILKSFVAGDQHQYAEVKASNVDDADIFHYKSPYVRDAFIDRVRKKLEKKGHSVTVNPKQNGKSS